MPTGIFGSAPLRIVRERDAVILCSVCRWGIPCRFFPIQTIADKCTWAPTSPEAPQGKPGDLIAYCGVPQTIPSQQFLDDWYKGIVHTSDEFYEVDASAASTTLLYNPQGDTSASLDVEDPSVDPSGQYLAFINAADQSLWVLRIEQ